MKTLVEEADELMTQLSKLLDEAIERVVDVHESEQLRDKFCDIVASRMMWKRRAKVSSSDDCTRRDTSENLKIRIDGVEYECRHGVRPRLGRGWAVCPATGLMLAFVQDERAWFGGTPRAKPSVNAIRGISDPKFEDACARAIAKKLGVLCGSAYTP